MFYTENFYVVEIKINVIRKMCMSYDVKLM